MPLLNSTTHTPVRFPLRMTKYSLLFIALLLAAAAALSVGLVSAQSSNGVYDKDGDRLIEVSNLQQLHFIRYDLDGDGLADDSANDAAYALGFPLGDDELVCDRTCHGYELNRSLDFNNGNSYQSGDINTNWTEGAGWEPIREFKATFYTARGFSDIRMGRDTRGTDTCPLLKI